MRPKFKIQHDPMSELDRLRNNVSMEAISFDGIKSALADFLPAVKENFERFANKFASRELPIALKANEREFIQLLNKTQYLKMTSYAVFIPEGLAVPYLVYLETLKDAIDHCFQTTEKSLNEFTTSLAQVITNRELKYYVAPMKSKFDAMEKNRALLVKRLGECFNQTTATTASYEDVVARNTEWSQIFSLLDVASNTTNKISHDHLHKKSEECNMLLSTIIRQIQNGEFVDAGPEVTNNLSNGAYQVASELEFFSMVYYRIMTLSTAISDTVNKVSEQVKQDN